MGSPPTDVLLLNGVAALVRDLAKFAPVHELFQTHLKRWRKKNALIVAQRSKVEAQLAKFWRKEPKAADPDEDEHWPARRIYSPDRTKSKLVPIPPELNRKLEKYNDPSRYHLLRSLDNKQDLSPTESFILLAELHDAAYPKGQLGYTQDQVHIVGLAEATKILAKGLSPVAVENLATLVERVLDQIEARPDFKSRNETGKTLQQIINRSRKKIADLVIHSRQHFVTHTDWESVQDEVSKLRSDLIVSNEELGRRLAMLIQIEARQRQRQTDADGQSNNAEFAFRPDGDGYFIRGFGEKGHVTAKGAKGLHDIFRVVQSPGVPVPMLELDAGAGTKQLDGDSRSEQPVANSETRQDITAKRRQLQADIENADTDFERDESRKELETLEREAAKLFGLTGKARDLNNPNDRLRAKLLGRKTRACKQMKDNGLSELAELFDLAVVSEGDCLVYRSATPNIAWVTEPKV